MRRADRTVATDDLLVQRFVQCMLCGRRPESLDFAFVEVHGLVVATAHCVLCRARDPDLRELLALLEQRYGAVRQETSSTAP